MRVIFVQSKILNSTLHYFMNCANSHLNRYAYPWWKDKVINSTLRRQEGLCPLTPEETELVFSALGFDPNVQIYVAAGEIYGRERRMESLVAAFPNLVSMKPQKQPFPYFVAWRCDNNLLYFSHYRSRKRLCWIPQT